MFPIVQTFVAWFFDGAAQEVIDFFAATLTGGLIALALLPIALIVKYIFK